MACTPQQCEEEKFIWRWFDECVPTSTDFLGTIMFIFAHFINETSFEFGKIYQPMTNKNGRFVIKCTSEKNSICR